jgi:uracil phosphoribosyltransferase
MTTLNPLENSCNLVRHPVLSHMLTQLRKSSTNPPEFRSIIRELSRLLAYEMTRTLGVNKEGIETPFEKMEAPVVVEKILLLPIQRAGNGMLDGMLQILPFASVGHIGIYRDKFIKKTVEYYFRIPSHCEGRRTFIIDPLLATGDTAVAAIDRLKEFEVGDISFVCLLAAPEGIIKLKNAHPDVQIFTLSIERELDAKGYIRPGLGDAGDRLYDTA